MSLDKMSASVRSRIVSRLKEVMTKGSGDSITQRKLKAFEEYTSRDQIRKDTDTVGGRHESIMSRLAFDNLLKDMSAAISQKELSNELTAAVANISFEGFIAYISEIYYKDKEFLITDNRRIKNGFIYSGPTRNTTESIAVYARPNLEEPSYKDVLILKNIPQGKLVTYYADYVAANSPGISENAKKQLKKSLQGGHLTGVFTARLVRAFGLRKTDAGQISFQNSQREFTELEKQLATIVDLVTDADFLSSNIALDVNLFTETDKRLYSNSAEVRLTTEVQFAKSNKAAGDLLTTAGTYLSKLISSINPNVSGPAQEKAAQDAFKKMLENLQKVSTYVKDRATQLKALENTQDLDPALEKKLLKILENQKTFDTLITTEGSPSILQHISNIVTATLNNKAEKPSRSVLKLKDNIKLGKLTKSTKPTTKPRRQKVNLKTKSPTIPVVPSTYSLTSLESLLNANLVEQVKQNMGSGNRRDVLNLRSGRFAESVKVERLSESRQGMITVFYSYMKNPYATFSQGGRQSSPSSRDPKLLIARSIREIAQTQVANRLRSVSV